MKLVDTLDEQELLEGIVERTKPAVPQQCRGMHWLLSTPFRYWPYPIGSRFRRAGQREGCYYASDLAETAVAELAFYRFVFFMQSPGVQLPTQSLEHTAFAVRVEAAACIRLNEAPFDADIDTWSNPVDYTGCQAFADLARTAEIGALRYTSVRDPGRGINIALLDPGSMASQAPETQQTWRLFVSPAAVQAFCETSRLRLEYKVEDWSGDPRIAEFLARTDSRPRST